MPQTDTYIEKDSSLNEEAERLRHSATNSLLTRRDVIVVATVSAIYGLGTLQEYVGRMITPGWSAGAGQRRCSVGWWASSTRERPLRQPRTFRVRGHPRGVSDV